MSTPAGWQLNNKGGGIFHFLPIANHGEFSPYFDTPHEHDFSRACEGFGLPYSLATTREAFEAAFEEARRAGGPHCIEVSADKEESHDIIAELRSAARPVAARVAVALQQSEVSVS